MNDIVKQLADRIHVRNSWRSPDSSAMFTQEDLQIVWQAISTTICACDLNEQAIYQPNLYRVETLSAIAWSVALADISTFEMQGIEAYNRERSLLFLEENLDIIPFIQNCQFSIFTQKYSEMTEILRQRLLQRTCFQAIFACSCLLRAKRERSGLPTTAISILIQKIFCYLNLITLNQ